MKHRALLFGVVLLLAVVMVAYFVVQYRWDHVFKGGVRDSHIEDIVTPFENLNLSDGEIEFLNLFIAEAKKRLESNVVYDPAYYELDYPNGDVPASVGVCTDVVIRSFRGAGVDLQELVHLDMSENFGLYPNTWGLNGPDTNIDHRRVPNLIVFFDRFAEVLPVTDNPGDYYPGDVITWAFRDGRTHTGVLVDKRNLLTGNPLIVHNVGRGPQLHDVLFEWEITGHYRYLPTE